MKVQITVRGRRYTIKSDEGDVDLQAIARYVDMKMAEIGGRSSAVDEYTVALLACLNIAQDYARFRREVDGELAAIDRELASTAVLISSALPAEPDGDAVAGEDA